MRSSGFIHSSGESLNKERGYSPATIDNVTTRIPRPWMNKGGIGINKTAGAPVKSTGGLRAFYPIGEPPK